MVFWIQQDQHTFFQKSIQIFFYWRFIIYLILTWDCQNLSTIIVLANWILFLSNVISSNNRLQTSNIFLAQKSVTSDLNQSRYLLWLNYAPKLIITEVDKDGQAIPLNKLDYIPYWDHAKFWSLDYYFEKIPLLIIW